MSISINQRYAELFTTLPKVASKTFWVSTPIDTYRKPADSNRLHKTTIFVEVKIKRPRVGFAIMRFSCLKQIATSF